MLLIDKNQPSSKYSSVDRTLASYLENTSDLAYVKDSRLAYAGASPAFASALGFGSAGELAGKTDAELFGGTETALLRSDRDAGVLSSKAPDVDSAEQLPLPNAEAAACLSSRYPVFGAEGAVSGVFCILRPTSAEQEDEGYQLELPPDALGAVMLDAQDWCIIGKQLRPEFGAALPDLSSPDEYFADLADGALRDEAIQNYFRGFTREYARSLCSGERRSHSLSYVRRFSDGSEHWVRTDVRFLSDLPNGHPCMVLVLLDIDTQKQNEQKLSHAAEFDELTGLLNRSATTKRISEFLEGEGADGIHALFIIDVDNFKAVNDTFGHQTGDRMLANIAVKIRRCFRDTDIIGRIGGDEFFVLMKYLSDAYAARTKAAALLETLQYVCSTPDASLELSGSVGISLYPENGTGLDSLYKAADQALYRAKERGKNQLSIAEEEAPAVLESSILRETAGSVHLRTLLENMEGAIFVFEVTDSAVRTVYCSHLDFLFPGPGASDPGSGVCPLLSSVPPQDLAALTEAIKASALDKSSLDFEYRVASAGGSVLWYHMRGSRLPEDGDHKLRLLAVTHDITAAKENERRLAFAKLRYRTAMELSGSMIIEANLIQRTTSYAGAFGGSLGLLGHVFHDAPDSVLAAGVVHPDSEGEFRRMFDDIFSGRESSEYIILYVAPDGGAHWASNRYTLLTDENGKPYYAIGVASPVANIETLMKLYSWEKRFCSAVAPHLLCTARINLSKDRVLAVSSTLHPDTRTAEGGRFAGLAGFIASRINRGDERAAFSGSVCREGLLEKFCSGHDWVFESFRCSPPGEESRWVSASIHLYRDPVTGDIYCSLYIKDIDYIKRLELSLDVSPATDALYMLYSAETTRAMVDAMLTHLPKGALCSMTVWQWKGVDHMRSAYGDSPIRSFTMNTPLLTRLLVSSHSIVGRIDPEHVAMISAGAASPAEARKDSARALDTLLSITRATFLDADMAIASGIDTLPATEASCDKLYARSLLACAASLKTASCPMITYGDENYDWPEPDAERSSSGHRQELMLDVEKQLALYRVMSHGGVFSVLADEGFTLLYGNDRFYAIIGYTRESLRSRLEGKCSGCIHPDDLPEVRNVIDGALSEGESSASWAMRIITGTGETKYVQASCEFSPQAGGTPIVNGVVIDVTEQRVAEGCLSARKNAAIKQYKYVMEQRDRIDSEAIVSVRLNLTKNFCTHGRCSYGAADSFILAATADGCLDGLNGLVSEKEKAAWLRQMFSRAGLLSSFEHGRHTVNAETRMRIAAGPVIWVRLIALMALNPASDDVEGFLFIHNIDKEKRADELIDKLTEQSFDFVALLDVTSERFIICRHCDSAKSFFPPKEGQSYRVRAQKAACAMAAGDDDRKKLLHELDLDLMLSCLRESGRYAFAHRVMTPSGVFRYKEWKALWLDESHDTLIFTRRDVSALYEAELDKLTGMLERQAFYRRVREKLDEDSSAAYVLLRCDIDRFKLYNDVFGTDAGDRLLSAIGAQISRTTPVGCLSGHIDADHFAVLLEDDPVDVRNWGDALEKWLSEYPSSFRLCSSIGVYRITERELDVPLMCDRAMLALKSVKSRYSNKLAFYREDMRTKILDEQALLNDVDEAFRSDQFVLYFQPQVDYETGGLVGAESLVRWKHPQRGLLPPGSFVPLFERNGLISRLDEYVWEKTCAHIRDWREKTGKLLPISVNISRLDIYDSNLRKKISDLAGKYSLPPSALKLELTESAYADNPEQLISVTRSLQAEGFTVEMDDFGAGYSSLNILKDVSVDILKLDIRFLAQTENDSRGGNILCSVIRMAHWLKMPIIAEGVETKANADYLKSLGCTYMQGFYFSRPLPESEFCRMLLNGRTGRTDKYSSTDVSGMGEFWNASAQMALLFNSYVGGAAILEYGNGNVEILRANDRFYRELETTRSDYIKLQMHTLDRFDSYYRGLYVTMLEKAAETGDEAECDLKSKPYCDGKPFWTHNRVRLLADNGKNRLYYLSVENITADKEQNERLRISEEALQLTVLRTGCSTICYDPALDAMSFISGDALGDIPELFSRGCLDFLCGERSPLHPENRIVLRERVQRVINGAPCCGSLKYRADMGDGSGYHRFRLDYSGTAGDDGHILRITGVVTRLDEPGEC